MKFKFGDRVKVVKCEVLGEYCKNINKISTITQLEKDVPYPYMLKGLDEVFSEDELELVREKQFTKFDLKDGDKCTLKNGQVIFFNKDSSRQRTLYAFDNLDKNFKYTINDDVSIVKVERPVKYETVFERKEEILDEVEKKYLADVIRPFRQHIMFISKTGFDGEEFLKIDFKRPVNSFSLPFFKKNSMYKGMKVDQKYTLEELGI